MQQLAGRAILVLDDSASISQAPRVPNQPVLPSRQGTNSLARMVSTVVNAAMRRWSESYDFPVAAFGYHGLPDGSAGFRGIDEFRSLSNIVADPVRTETREKTKPDGTTEEFDFPIYYEPDPKGKACQLAAFEKCQQLLETSPAQGRPVVIHISTGPSADGNPLKVAQAVQSFGEESPLVVQVRLARVADPQKYLFPANRHYLPAPAREPFGCSSELSETLRDYLSGREIKAHRGARALVYNATALELAECLRLVDFFASEVWSPAEASQTTVTVPDEATEEPATIPLASDEPASEEVETVADSAEEEIPALDKMGADSVTDEEAEEASPLVMEDGDAGLSEETTDDAGTFASSAKLFCFLLDRGVADPYSRASGQLFDTLQSRCNRLIHEVAGGGDEECSVLAITYGVDSEGDVDVREVFAENGSSAVIEAANLSDAVLRIEEGTKEIPDGVGGLLTIPDTQTIYIETQPASTGGISEAFEHVLQSTSEWRDRNAGAECWLVHATCAEQSEEQLETLRSGIQQLAGQTSLVLCHAIVTSKPNDDSVVEKLGELTADHLRDGLSVGEQMAINSELKIISLCLSHD